MNFEKNKENIYVKNAVDYEYLNSRNKDSRQADSVSNSEAIESSSDYNLSSIDKKIMNILNFCDDDVEGNSSESCDSNMDGTGGNPVDCLDDADLDDELELICSLGLNPFEGGGENLGLDSFGEGNEAIGIDNDSFADYFNPSFENHPDEVAMLSFFNDFVLVEMSFDDLIREVYFEE